MESYQLPPIGYIPLDTIKAMISNSSPNENMPCNPYFILNLEKMLKGINDIAEEVFEKSDIVDSAVKECVHSNYCSYRDRADYMNVILNKINKIVNFPSKNIFPKGIIEESFKEDSRDLIGRHSTHNHLLFATSSLILFHSVL